MKVNKLTKDLNFPLVYQFSQEMQGMKNPKAAMVHTSSTLNEAKVFVRKFYKPICKLV